MGGLYATKNYIPVNHWVKKTTLWQVYNFVFVFFLIINLHDLYEVK